MFGSETVSDVTLVALVVAWILLTWLAPPLSARRASTVSGRRRLALLGLSVSVIALVGLARASSGRARVVDLIAGSALVFASAAHTFRSDLFERRWRLAAAKTPHLARAWLKSLVTHNVFGLGLYLCALGARHVPWIRA